MFSGSSGITASPLSPSLSVSDHFRTHSRGLTTYVATPQTCLIYFLPSIALIFPKESSRAYRVMLSNFGGTLPSMFITQKRPHTTANSVTSIDILDDDSLINIFRLYRPDLLDEEETNDVRILQGGEWRRECWWYKLVHVCRRWRSLILASASHLGLSLLCTRRTPVADMLAHSPPLPLVIDYADKKRNFTPLEEEGIKLALRHHDRVRRIRFAMVVPCLRALFSAIDKEFPTLEYLYIDPLTYSDKGLILPETFRAPNLRHLVLLNFALPVGSSLLATATGLVTFSLNFIPPSVSWHPPDCLNRVSSMPDLQTLGISFYSIVSNHDLGRRVVNTPNVAHVVLPNLRWLGFQGGSAYMEALLPHMTTPRLEKLQLYLFNELISIRNLQQFISSAENLRFTSVSLRFGRMGFALQAYPRKGSAMYAASTVVYRIGHDWPLSTTTQMLGVLGPALPMVMHLSVGICDKGHMLWSGIPRYNDADRAEWRDILRSFNNVKTLRVTDGFIGDISRALKVRDGESTMELLPELKELICSARVDPDDLFDSFATFIYARQQAGHPVALISR